MASGSSRQNTFSPLAKSFLHSLVPFIVLAPLIIRYVLVKSSSIKKEIAVIKGDWELVTTLR